jgi:phosphoribosyl-dephospho-CoA transferase
LVICQQSRLDTGTQFSTTRIAAGLPLPPSLGKRRLAFMIQPDTIARSAHPLALTDIIPHLPVEWRRPLLQLSRGGEAIGLEFRVYGSAAWEALTGLSYLTPESDIDLLWRPTGTAQLADGIALLANWEAATGRHVDGEILFRDDDAVAWREWAEAERKHASPRFLVKSLAGPRLCTRAELQARLSRPEEAMTLCH